MKQIKVLFGWALPLAASISFLALMACPAEGSMPDASSGNVPAAANLTAFSVKLSDEAEAESILSPGFAAGTRAYEGEVSWNVETLASGQTLHISASAEAGNIVEILINGVSKVKSEGEAVTASTNCDAPKYGSTVSITARAYKKGVPVPVNQRNYTAAISPGQLNVDDNNDLLNLYVGHTELSGNKLDPQFEASVTSGYEVVADNDATTGFVKVVAASKKASVEILYNQVKISDPSDDGKAQGEFTMPAIGGQSKTLEIVVTAKRADPDNPGEWLPYPKTYSIEINGYQLQNNTYSGTVALDGTITSTYDGIEIMGVTAIGSGATQKAAQLDKSQAICVWSFNAIETWTPAAFTVTLKKADGTTMESKSYPYNPPLKTGIALQIGGTAELGNRIYSANDFYYYLNSNAYNGQNFSLANNIDLAGYKDVNGNPVDWVGPSGYHGTLYGNGYTIKNLVLSKNIPGEINKTALFSTLGNGAVLRDFNIEVSIKDSAKIRNNNATYFGSVVGLVDLAASQSVTLHGIKTKGTLDFTSQSQQFIIIGGFIAEIQKFGTVNIENCGSELNASVASYTRDYDGTIAGLGGFIGRIVGNHNANTLTVNISNSYATGNMSVSGNITTASLFCGGFVGDILSHGTNMAVTVSLTNCYATGAMSVTNTGALLANGELGSGGLIGLAWKDGSGSLNITAANCVAAGEQALLNYTSNGNGTVANSRFIGVSGIKQPSTVTITNGIARKGMLLGASPGTPDDSEGDLNNGGNLGKTSGLAKTDAELKTEATWTGAGWDSSVWDFSGLSQGKWPTLK
ncbi:MAG: hypothetical protein LBC77_06090 [Spirochaetaceae bacterium]|jgi:hypothetical protein|nr:hypothetical protein [Spirochaetaceae bacterium]